MNNPPKRHLEELSDAEQIKVLEGMKAFLLGALLEHLQKGNIGPERVPDHIKREIATNTEQPTNVNWNEAPSAQVPLDTASVLKEAERIIAGCCPACGSSNIQSSTQNGARLYDWLDCGHSWEG